MKLHVFGVGSGIEPNAGFHHTCLAIETETGLYFIDAGELGAYTAHLNGVDLLKTRTVFITHSHMDHVGGLGNLLWYIRKLCVAKKTKTNTPNIDIVAPEKDVFDATMMLLKNTEGDFVCDHSHTFIKTDESLSYCSCDGELKATAVHTDHLDKRNGEYRSYAYITECEGKKLMFMGDMRLEDIKRAVPDSGVDALFVETGHYPVETVAQTVKDADKKIGHLFFVHHGKSVRVDIPKAQQTAEEIFGKNVTVTEEGKFYII